MNDRDMQALTNSEAKDSIAGAVIAAAIAAGVEIIKLLDGKPGSPVVAIVTNKSKRDFNAYGFGSNHGHNIVQIDAPLAGLTTISSIFIDAVRAEFGDEYTYDDMRKVRHRLMEAWQYHLSGPGNTT